MSRRDGPLCALDHLVVVAPDLGRGVDWLRQALGVEPGPGGAHPRMGTHNRLMRLQPGLYLEVIAPDPAAPSPGRPRWFGLDDLSPEDEPRLAAWVVRTDNLEAACDAAGLDLGRVEPMSRGPWSWRITVPATGRCAAEGLAPMLIEWPAGRHPVDAMPDAGVRLTQFTLHPRAPVALQTLVDRLGLSDAVRVAPEVDAARAPGLEASFTSPAGARRLGPPGSIRR